MAYVAHSKLRGNYFRLYGQVHLCFAWHEIAIPGTRDSAYNFSDLSSAVNNVTRILLDATIHSPALSLSLSFSITLPQNEFFFYYQPCDKLAFPSCPQIIVFCNNHVQPGMKILM